MVFKKKDDTGTPDTPDTADTFLQQFPMFYPDTEEGFPGYRWKHPDDPDRRILLYRDTFSGWCVLVSEHHERELAVPRGTYDEGGFETAEAAAAWLLLEGLITCGTP